MVVSGKPLRVAVVGAGPAGFFATAELLKRVDLEPHVDLFERLPTPFGLVRSGVAPDHQSIKAVTGRYARDVESGGPRFRLLGNVEVGRDVSIEELEARYQAVVFAFGAQSNRRLDIPGEGLAGVHPASVFVAWYNGHPDCVDVRFELGVERVVVIGVGNVGLDVARILMKPLDDLRKTDISDLALQVLARRQVQEVIILGRHTQAQSTYTPPELEELTRIPDCDLVVSAADRLLDEATLALRQAGKLDARVARNLKIVEDQALLEPRPGRRVVRLKYFSTPTEVLGEDRVSALRIRTNRVVVRPDGEVGLEPTGASEDLACGLLFRAIGYRVVPVGKLPLDPKTGTLYHRKGQIVDGEDQHPLRGLFATGWAKRGPQGIIGTNKPDAAETIATLLEANERGQLLAPTLGEEEGDVVRLLQQRAIPLVSYSDWRRLDEIEVSTGKAEGRPRRKFTDVPSMLAALGQAQMPGLVGSGGSPR
jgi:ferredoxin/flavodoxin---NADP+ reductase